MLGDWWNRLPTGWRILVMIVFAIAAIVAVRLCAMAIVVIVRFLLKMRGAGPTLRYTEADPFLLGTFLLSRRPSLR